MDRRGLIAAAGIGAAAALSPHANAAVPVKQLPQPNPSGKLLVHKDRARELMARYGIDGLIAANPINVYYLANVMPLNVRYRSDLNNFATFPRDANQPSFVISSPSETFDIANRDREIPEAIFIGGIDPSAKIEPGVEPPATKPRRYAPSLDWKFTEREKAWMALQKQVQDNAAPGAAWAIVRALKRSGLEKGRIAVDDMRVKYMLEQIGFEGVTLVPGEDLFRLIRMVKSEPEVEIMRIAGRNNGEAAVAAMKQFEPGMTFNDFRNIFRRTAADVGSQYQSLLLGLPGGMLADGVGVKGRSYHVDAVATFADYFGDFGRTLVLGEPTKRMQVHANAQLIARDTVFALAKPGVKFADVRKAGLDALIKNGVREECAFVTAHCVGLAHTDNPARLAGIDNTPLDHVFEENMFLTIDLPTLEVGQGGGHFEDLIRITKTGVEVINQVSEPMVIVG